MADRLNGKIAVITCAGRGIGEATACALTHKGAPIVIAEQHEVTGRAVVSSLVEDGAEAAFFATDVTDQTSVDDCMTTVLQRFGRIDILVNNAGIDVFHEPLATTDAVWQRCIAVDLDGVWCVTRAALLATLDRGGAIVNIGSCQSSAIIPGCFSYPVAKHGLLGLTRALGIEYAVRGVRVNANAPAMSRRRSPSIAGTAFRTRRLNASGSAIWTRRNASVGCRKSR